MAIFDDLFLLRAFVSIVENGSISAAARSLRMAQPTRRVWLFGSMPILSFIADLTRCL